MGTSTLMSVGVKAMAANYAALQTTGNNIANANVTGYSRQQVELATAQGQYTGAGFFGRGVDVTSVTRAHDDFLTSEAVNAKALSAMDSARLSQLQGLENIFQIGAQGLGDATSQLFTAMTDVSSNPSDLSARQVALSRAGDLATRFAQAGSALDELQTGVTSQLTTAVANVNTLAQGIADVNQRIAVTRGTGQPANDLLDERDRLISSLSEQVQVTRLDASDGSVALFIGGGQRLVLGSQAAQLKVTQDASDPTRSAIGVVDNGVTRALDDAAIGGGAMKGLLSFQNGELAQGRNLIGRLALSVGRAINTQQSLGLTLQPPLGQSQGAAMFAFGPSQALPNAANARDAAGNPIASVALTITDPAALQASDYELRASASSPGSWQLTRLADGKVSTIANGATVDGMRIDISNAQPGDRFLLQPVARAANGMTSLLADPRDIAAAAPLTATTAAANTGTAAVARLDITAASLPTPGATARITFTDDQGGYSWQLLDAGNAVVGSGTGTWQAGQAVPTPPQDINGFSLQLSGVPRNGDLVTVAPTPASAVASNNGNALAFAALRDAKLADGHTATDTWALALADVGVSVQSAKSAASLSSAVSTQAEQSRSSQAGVNLDEEAAKLIQYQQSYQAAAKVLQVAQALFDTLLQTTAR